MTAAPGTLQAGAIFTTAGQAAAAFISDGGTRAARNSRAWSVRRLDDMFGGLDGWLAAPPGRRLDAPVDVRGVAVWLALATAAPVDAAYIAACSAEWGYRLADLEPRMAAAFTAAATAARVLRPAIRSPVGHTGQAGGRRRAASRAARPAPFRCCP